MTENDRTATTPTPREVFHRGLELLLAKDMTGFVALFAVDAEFELPFAAPGGVRRLSGRAALAEYLDGYPERLDIAEFPEVLVHETADPEVIVVEFTARGTTVATGGAYRLDYIAVLTVRDGRFVRYRDYWSPLAVAEATGVRA